MMFDDVNETDGMRLSQTSNLQSKFVGKLRIKQNNVSLNIVVNVLALASAYSLWSFGVFNAPWLWLRLYDSSSQKATGIGEGRLIFEGQFRFLQIKSVDQNSSWIDLKTLMNGSGGDGAKTEMNGVQ